MGNFLDKKDRTLAPVPVGPGVDKIEKYRWARPTSPGHFRLINKNLLNLEQDYQRNEASNGAVSRIARFWDWALFGVLKVAERSDKSFWVFDGGHRLRASFYRSDIHELPCMVYPFSEVSEEARVFLAGAQMISRISSFDWFHAANTAEQPDAVATSDLFDEFGLIPDQHASGPNKIKCVGTIYKAVAENEETARKTLAACLCIAGDRAVSAIVYKGLFTLAQHYNGRDILGEYEEALARLTQEEVERAIRQLAAELGKGGATVAAKAIVNVLNKGKKTKKLIW